MTDQFTSETAVLERRLIDALDAAHHDPRWAGTEWREPLGRVRRAGRGRRARTVVATAVSVAVVGSGVGLGLSSLAATSDSIRIAPIGTQPGDGTGLNWLLTPQQYDAYVAAHPSPSDNPERVSSPAPESPALDQLRADAAAALPAGTRVIRADAADGGQPGHTTMWLRLADGTPVAVERYRLQYPVEAGMSQYPAGTASPTGGDRAASSETSTTPDTWPDGSAYTVLTGDAMGYSFGLGEQWSGPIVWTVTPDGWFTSWTAPVSTARLLGWAQAADAHSAA